MGRRETNLRSNEGLRATITNLERGVRLTLRDRRGHKLTSRRKDSYNVAMDELWRLDRGWRIA